MLIIGISKYTILKICCDKKIVFLRSLLHLDDLARESIVFGVYICV